MLRSLLEEVGGWPVVGEADSGEAAIPLVEQLVPDVVLMDCRMPGQGGVAATREIVLVRGMGGKVWVGDAPGGGPASWSSCPTWPRYRIAPPAPGTAGAVETSKPV